MSGGIAEPQQPRIAIEPLLETVRNAAASMRDMAAHIPHLEGWTSEIANENDRLRDEIADASHRLEVAYTSIETEKARADTASHHAARHANRVEDLERELAKVISDLARVAETIESVLVVH